MRVGLLIVALVAACSATHPGTTGIPVTKDGPCHQLLRAQCKCCGSGEPLCTGQVDFLVESGTAVSNQSAAECQATLDALPGDALCKSLDSPARLEAACQQFPPQPDAGVAADGSADATAE